MKTKRIVKPFQTKYNQTIQPGDKVIAVTMSQGHLNVRQAEYIGYVERKGNAYAQVRGLSKKWVLFVKGTNYEAKWPWSTDDTEYRAVEVERIYTLLHNRMFHIQSSASDLAAAIM